MNCKQTKGHHRVSGFGPEALDQAPAGAWLVYPDEDKCPSCGEAIPRKEVSAKEFSQKAARMGAEHACNQETCQDEVCCWAERLWMIEHCPDAGEEEKAEATALLNADVL